ncbi:MAG: hypothetical protein WAO76_17575, partial [Georgfuchsia sp.]
MFQSVKIGTKTVVAIGVLLVATWSLMIYLTYAHQRDAAIAQSHEFAESVNQMTVASITAMMITGVSKERAVFLDQIRNSSGIKDIRVLRYGSVIKDYGAGDASESAPTAEETAAMEKGQSLFRVDADNGSLNAIIPMLNSKNYLGKDCTSCHEGKEDEVLGAVSMKVSIQKEQAELRSFTWWISMIALILSLPLLGAVYFFIRRFVTLPLGGEPAAATDAVNRIAEGDLTFDVPVRKGDSSSLLYAVKHMQENLTNFIADMNHMSKEHDAGDIDVKIDEGKFKNDFQVMAGGVNNMVSGHIA